MSRLLRRPGSKLSPRSKIVDKVLEATIVGSFTSCGYEARKLVFDWNDLASMSGQTVLLTGGTSGIGRATADMLYRLGANVIITSRSQERAEAAAGELEQASESDGSVTGAELDTAELASVDALVTRIGNEYESVRVLINNAGALTSDYQTNAAGMELTLASHLVGPYHLMMLLRPMMSPGARVLWMSSGGMYSQGLDVGSLEMDEASYKGVAAYAKAKRAQVELVYHLGPLWAPGVVLHAMHPGWVATAGVDQSLPGFAQIVGPALRSADQGADTMAWLASGGADQAKPGGFYLDRIRRGTSYLPGTATNAAERSRLIDWLNANTGR